MATIFDWPSRYFEAANVRLGWKADFGAAPQAGHSALSLRPTSAVRGDKLLLASMIDRTGMRSGGMTFSARHDTVRSSANALNNSEMREFHGPTA